MLLPVDQNYLRLYEFSFSTETEDRTLPMILRLLPTYCRKCCIMRIEGDQMATLLRTVEMSQNIVEQSLATEAIWALCKD